MTARKAIALSGVAAAGFAGVIRPRLLRWGATDEEVDGPFPGSGIVPHGERASTMATTIDASAEDVWPWLVQMGWERGGWYSWDRVDNGGRPSASTVHPEWQDLIVGSQVRACSPNGRLLAPWTVAILEPNQFLGLHKLTDLRGRGLDPREPRPAAYMEGLWGFQLKDLAGGRSRLVIGGYQAARPRWLAHLVFDWSNVVVVWIMQARMLSVLKRSVERAGAARTESVTSPDDLHLGSRTLTATA